jgi:Na+/proline symporter
MKNDAVFPLFIATQLPVGIAGLVIAGIFAAAQSTISTSMNSTATAVVTDFCMPLGMCGTDRGYLRLARLVTALLGVGGTLVACWLAQVGNAMAIDAFIAVIGLFGGAVSGVFMLGMLTRRANVAGAMIGSILGFAAVLWTMYDRSINIHPFLYAAIGTVTTVVAGYLASLLARPLPPSRLAGLTIFDRHHN